MSPQKKPRQRSKKWEAPVRPRTWFELPEAERKKRFLAQLKSCFLDPDEKRPAWVPEDFKIPIDPHLYDPQNVRSEFRCFGCCPSLKFSHAVSQFTRSARKAESYWDDVEDAYKPITDIYSYRIPPRKGSIMTHMSAKLWITAYCAKYLVMDDEQYEVSDAEFLCIAFAQVILEGEKVLVILQRFAHSLKDLCHTVSPYVQHMKHIMDHLMDPHKEVELTITEMEDKEFADEIRKTLKKTVKKILLSGSKARFERQCGSLNTYMRMARNRRWFKFDSFPKDDRLTYLCDGISNVATDFIRIGYLLKSAKTVLDRGLGSQLKSNLYPHILKMHKRLIKMCTSEEHLKLNRKRIVEEIRNLDTLVTSMEMHGKVICMQIMETVAMAHLCFDHVREYVPMKTEYFTYDSTIREKWDKNFVTSNLPQDLLLHTKDNFFMTSYSDALRRIPAGFKDIEICLHSRAPYALRAKMQLIQDQLENKKALGLKTCFRGRTSGGGAGTHKHHFQKDESRISLLGESGSVMLINHLSRNNPKSQEVRSSDKNKSNGHRSTSQSHSHENPEDDDITNILSPIRSESKSRSQRSTPGASRSRSARRLGSKPFVNDPSGSLSQGRKARSRFVRGKGPKRKMTKTEQEKNELDTATRKWKRKLKADEEYKKKHGQADAKIPLQELQRRLQAITAGRSQMRNSKSGARDSGSSNPKEQLMAAMLTTQLQLPGSDSTALKRHKSKHHKLGHVPTTPRASM